MFYKVTINDHIRVPPKLFHLPTKEAVIKRIKKKYDGFISKELGVVVDVADVHDIQDGTVIPTDGAAYFNTTFELYTFKPELQEVALGNIRDIADFGAFVNLGPIEGMIHISQTMDDFVSFAKDKTLAGKDTKRVLRVNDKCKARIIAVSFKDLANPKLGLTMRQKFLGRVEWIDEDVKGPIKPAAKEAPQKKQRGKEAK
ncbi:MAG: DNA-directed RNA polymerase [Candidatus Woesearchaeota archaeon]|nr:DNA-directed RNA polymerase [Candidatus Woesearchaeota archaeon]